MGRVIFQSFQTFQGFQAVKSQKFKPFKSFFTFYSVISKTFDILRIDCAEKSFCGRNYHFIRDDSLNSRIPD